MPFNAVLLWLHIFSGASWFGATLLFATIVGPTIGDFTPTTSNEVVVKMLPKYLRFTVILTLVAPILGLVTALDYSGWSFTVFSTGSTFGTYMTAGAVFSLLTWVVVLGVVYPTGNKIVSIHRGIEKGQPQPASLPGLAMRLKVSSGIGLALLIAILICMVAATY